jgi:hypothetical protein
VVEDLLGEVFGRCMAGGGGGGHRAFTFLLPSSWCSSDDRPAMLRFG